MKLPLYVFLAASAISPSFVKSESVDTANEPSTSICGIDKYLSCMGLSREACISHYKNAYNACPKKSYKGMEYADPVCTTERFIRHTEVAPETIAKCDSLLERMLIREKSGPLPKKY
ncbi:MAG: hypothetical protein JAZ06_00805 [Candidatus Thiodiazotropha taylori]|nr:hypothetical protein [Candidatus Thiodiazotropha taylori]